MQLTHEERGKYLVIKAIGRLDASWSEHFSDTLLQHIRHGHHQLLINASGLSFLSSAGIRSLMQIHKELLKVQGSFLVLNATPFVSKTLEMTGLGFWLAAAPPNDLQAGHIETHSDRPSLTDVYLLDPEAFLKFSAPASWLPWNTVNPADIIGMSFPKGLYALGIGSTDHKPGASQGRFGDFMALDGNVIYQPPQEKEHPDYLISEKDYIPELQLIQAITCTGSYSHLLRFSPDQNRDLFPISELMRLVLSHTGSAIAAFLVIAEIEGLVGASLIKSPGMLTSESIIDFPEIREWLSFCGERVYANQQGLLFGVVSSIENKNPHPLIPPLPSDANLSAHIHAAVFPYQPLQNGQIDLGNSIAKFFNGPPPLALLHLIDDTRPAIGLGESTLIRGACWCGPILNMEASS